MAKTCTACGHVATEEEKGNPDMSDDCPECGGKGTMKEEGEAEKSE